MAKGLQSFLKVLLETSIAHLWKVCAANLLAPVPILLWRMEPCAFLFGKVWLYARNGTKWGGKKKGITFSLEEKNEEDSQAMKSSGVIM